MTIGNYVRAGIVGLAMAIGGCSRPDKEFFAVDTDHDGKVDVAYRIDNSGECWRVPVQYETEKDVQKVKFGLLSQQTPCDQHDYMAFLRPTYIIQEPNEGK